MSVESSIPRLCKSVKTFGRTPVSVPQVRGESCGTETGVWPNVLTDLERRGMELSTDMLKSL